jgi:Ca2+:H+ antiporter
MLNCLLIFIGPRPMDLMFTPAEVLAIFLSVLITGQIASDGESNWIEGVQLLAVYLIMAIVFYFLPESGAGLQLTRLDDRDRVQICGVHCAV